MHAAFSWKKKNGEKIVDIVCKNASRREEWSLRYFDAIRHGLGLLFSDAFLLFFGAKALIFNQDLFRFYDALFRLLNVDLILWIISRKDFINGAERLIKRSEREALAKAIYGESFFAWPIRLPSPPRLNVFLKQHQTRSWELTVKALNLISRAKEEWNARVLKSR